MTTPDVPAATGEMLPPAERLAQSRARLRNAWVRTHPPARSTRRDGSAGEPASESLPGLLGSLLNGWWQQHPLHTFSGLAGEVAAPAARAVLAPTAERHPLALVVGAAVAGALVVAARPWRWLPEAALSSMLLSTLWPKGQLQQWLSVDGLNRLLGSGGFATLLNAFTRHPDRAPDTNVAGPAAPAVPVASDPTALHTEAARPVPVPPTPLATADTPAVVSA